MNRTSLIAPVVLILLIGCLITTANAEILHLTPEYFDPYVDSAYYYPDLEIESGDTVLLAPGLYNRPFRFNKSVTLASWFLFSGNSEHIGSTVIDGHDLYYRALVEVSTAGENDSTSSVEITGLSFVSKYNQLIMIGSCHDVKLSYCKIVGNKAFNQIESVDKLSINNFIIVGNRHFYGRSVLNLVFINELQIKNSVIADNGSGIYMAGIYSGIIDKLTLLNSGRYYYRSYLGLHTEFHLRNSIIWGSSENIIDLSTSRYPDDHYFDYTVIKDSLDGILNDRGLLHWGEGNLNQDPLTYPLANYDYDYYDNSPCIDAGDPNSPLDPDGSRCDIGASRILVDHYISGTVEDAATGYNLAGAEIYINPIPEPLAITDENGNWSMQVGPDRYLNLIVKKRGYNPVRIDSFYVSPDNRRHLNFELNHPELYVNRESYHVELASGDTVTREFNIFNDGNGPLEWRIKGEFLGGSFPSFKILNNFNVSDWTGNSEVRSVVHAHGKYYFAAKQLNAEHWINQIFIVNIADSSLVVVDQPQPDDIDGFEDMAFDPVSDKIWASVGRTVYILNEDAEVEGYFTAYHVERQIPEDIEGMAWDTDRKRLIFATDHGDIYEYTSAGEYKRRLDIQLNYPKGLAYRYDDPDGFNLYTTNIFRYNYVGIAKIDVETDSLIQLSYPDRRYRYSYPTAIEFTYDISRNDSHLLELRNGGHSLHLNYINVISDWCRAQPSSGVLEPEEETRITLTFDARNVVPDHITGILHFHTNSYENDYTMPLGMKVLNTVDFEHKELISTDLAITSVAPNPFNSTTTISYTLPAAGEVSVVLYDLRGREVAEIYSGQRVAGSYEQTIDASKLASGVYLLQLKTASRTVSRKIISLK